MFGLTSSRTKRKNEQEEENLLQRANSSKSGFLQSVYQATDHRIPQLLHKETKGDTQTVDIDRALELTGHKWFHWRLLCLGGFAFLTTGFEFTLHGYIQPLSQCDLDLNASKMGTMNAVFLGGSLISSLFWGIIADAFGRKRVLVFALILEGLFTVVASWSKSAEMFTIVRCCSGFLCGGGATVLLSYVGEFCTDAKRPRNICLMGFAWTLSWMIMPGLASIIMPLTWELDVGFIIYKPWRLFVALVGIPNSISGILLLIFIPESPKYFLSKGMEEESLKVLRGMYASNTGNPASTYPVTSVVLSKALSDEDHSVTSSNRSSSIGALCTVMCTQMQSLLRPPLLWSTLLSASVYVCGMFAYYGFGLWLPELFNRLEEFYENHPNATTTVCQLQNSTLVPDEVDSLDCNARTVSTQMFINTFILGASCFVGNLTVTALSSKVQVRLLSAAFLEVAAACIVAVYFVESRILNLILCSGFLSLTNAALSAHNTCAINLFPTAVRGMGVCLSFLLGRLSAVIGSIMFGQLIEDHCIVPFLLVGGILAVGGVCSTLIPKSSQKAKE